MNLAHVIGLDLGKQSDYSALALLRWQLEDITRVELPYGPIRPKLLFNPPKRSYLVPTLKRWHLGTPYRDIAAQVARFLKLPALSQAPWPPVLVVDATGVGDPVCEMIREEMARAQVPGGMCQVTITGGSATTRPNHGCWHVAKKTLASILMVLLGHRRLQVLPQLAEAKTLASELGTFTVKITPAGNESFESWRERDHDDLVLAVALAAWAAETLDWPPLEAIPQPTRYRA